MSSQGVTHFWDESTDFQPLESFERDYFLYAQTMRLRLFRLFRMWKCFKVGPNDEVLDGGADTGMLLFKQLASM